MFLHIIDFLAARETVMLRLVIIKGSAIDYYDLKLASAIFFEWDCIWYILLGAHACPYILLSIELDSIK